jgi:prepilin signal peptidase PulO-like enzyme (type II secretory pathway)
VDTIASIWIIKSLLVLTLLYLAYIDWRTFRLPNVITFPLIILGILFNWLSDLRLTSLTFAILGTALGYGSLWTLNAGYRLLKNRNGIGMGDAKLLAALGAWLGWNAIPNILLAGSITGIIGGIAWLKWHGSELKQEFPFGPFLVIAGIIELLWPHFLQTLVLPSLT